MLKVWRGPPARKSFHIRCPNLMYCLFGLFFLDFFSIVFAQMSYFSLVFYIRRTVIFDKINNPQTVFGNSLQMSTHTTRWWSAMWPVGLPTVLEKELTLGRMLTLHFALTSSTHLEESTIWPMPSTAWIPFWTLRMMVAEVLICCHSFWNSV